MDVQINGVQSIHSVVAPRLAILILVGGQVVQIHRFSIHAPYGHLFQRTGKLAGGDVESHTPAVSVSLGMCHLTHHIDATDETAYGRFHVSRRKTVGSQHKRVVCNLYVFADASRHLHTPHIFDLLQRWFHLPLDVFLQLLIAQVGVHLIGQQQPRRFLSALLIYHLTTREVGIAHPLWQPFTHLPQQRCYLKLHGRDISVFL